MVDTTQANDVTSPTTKELGDVRRQIERDEGHNLIASDRVEGTNVYRPNGEKIGRIRRFMVGKRSGQVEYAVMSFGGFLGMGQELRPVPWEALDYDVNKGGYIVSAEEETLLNSPYIREEKEPAWDRAYGMHVFGYWGVPY
ncbi:PRC-barrel domain-containing protein [Croceicoccus bisphenolivorans]|uniref:PRC-barrel domain-containing protein n=1 Tax=Croceicoccus bisphenolivorans TaxID=1783232 RepID=UPI0009EE8D04|nr:PRC-barrel domain-containing protein [Croceicoccus bisphenolivorans]